MWTTPWVWFWFAARCRRVKTGSLAPISPIPHVSSHHLTGLVLLPRTRTAFSSNSALLRLDSTRPASLNDLVTKTKTKNENKNTTHDKPANRQNLVLATRLSPSSLVYVSRFPSLVSVSSSLVARLAFRLAFRLAISSRFSLPPILVLSPQSNLSHTQLSLPFPLSSSRSLDPIHRTTHARTSASTRTRTHASRKFPRLPALAVLVARSLLYFFRLVSPFSLLVLSRLSSFLSLSHRSSCSTALCAATPPLPFRWNGDRSCTLAIWWPMAIAISFRVFFINVSSSCSLRQCPCVSCLCSRWFDSIWLDLI